MDIHGDWKTTFFLVLITVVGWHWGFFCGVAHGLPVEPRIILSAIDMPGIILR